MDDANTVTLHEGTPRKNWHGVRMPDWVDEGSRLYTGVTVNAAGREWHEIVVAYDGEATTAYLTANGYDLALHGPAIHTVRGKGACYRRVLREWFRETYHMEVRFE